MPARPVPRVTRRTTLGVLAVTVLAGCDAVPGQSARSSSSPSTPSPTPGPDLLLLTEALESTDATLALVREVRTRRPALRPATAGLVELHLTQRQVFVGAGAVSSAAGFSLPLGGPDQVLRVVVQQEQALQRDLGRWALQAGDGGVARLLASASAGVAQHLVSLRGTAP